MDPKNNSQMTRDELMTVAPLPKLPSAEEFEAQTKIPRTLTSPMRPPRSDEMKAISEALKQYNKQCASFDSYVSRNSAQYCDWLRAQSAMPPSPTSRNESAKASAEARLAYMLYRTNLTN